MRKSLDAFGHAILIVFMDTLAQRIKSSRKLRKMTQKKLAGLVGVSTSSISQYESEAGIASEPSVKTLGKIARSLDVSFEWLATGRGKQGIEEFLIDITEMYKDDNSLVLLSDQQKQLVDVYEDMSDDWREKYLGIGVAVVHYHVGREYTSSEPNKIPTYNRVSYSDYGSYNTSDYVTGFAEEPDNKYDRYSAEYRKKKTKKED